MRTILCFAWPAEAKPWIEKATCTLRYQVKHVRYYEGSDYDVLIAGMGKYQLPAAIGWIQGLLPHDKIWWNIGIAGGPHKALHQWFQITAVRSEWSGDTFYPDMASTPVLPIATLKTFEKPASAEMITAEGGLVDMEGFTFCKAAHLFASTSQIQLLKWVSDTGVENFDKNNWQKTYSTSIDAPLQIVLDYQDKIKSIQAAFKPDIGKYLQPIREKLNPTFSQQVMIKDSLYFARQYHTEAYIEKLIAAIPRHLKQKKDKSNVLLQLLNELKDV